MSSIRSAVHTSEAPDPAGAYSQGILAGGLLFLAGQTPRLPDGRRLNNSTFEIQTRQALHNLNAVAVAAGARLADAVMVTVFLTDISNAITFDAIWQDFVEVPFPARAIVQSDLPGFAIEISAILVAG